MRRRHHSRVFVSRQLRAASQPRPGMRFLARGQADGRRAAGGGELETQPSHSLLSARAQKGDGLLSNRLAAIGGDAREPPSRIPADSAEQLSRRARRRRAKRGGASAQLGPVRPACALYLRAGAAMRRERSPRTVRPPVWRRGSRRAGSRRGPTRLSSSGSQLAGGPRLPPAAPARVA